MGIQRIGPIVKIPRRAIIGEEVAPIERESSANVGLELRVASVLTDGS
jgi:hypothetical protein